MSESALEPDATGLADFATTAARGMVDFLSAVDHRPVTLSEDDAMPAMSPINEHAADASTVLEETFRAAEYAVETASPRHFGYIPGGGLPTSAVAEMLARGLNRYVAASSMAPAFAALENDVLRWALKICGLADGGGLITTGGSAATLSAVVAARHSRLGEAAGNGTLYVTDQTNHSVVKAAQIAGLNRAGVRTVPTTSRLAMDPEALRRALHTDRAHGRRPFLVVATAGTTSAGTVDDLLALGDIAREEGAWFHVDAAYGGFFMLTARGRELMQGLEYADSIVLDPHKSLFLPYGTGMLLVRDVAALARGHTPEAEFPVYLKDLQRLDNSPLDSADLGLERSREFRGLRVWLPLRVHGVAAFRSALDEKLDLARTVHQELSTHPDLECPWSPDLSTVVFRARAGDAATRTLRGWINASGRAFCSGTEIHGRYYVRLCVLSFRTHANHVHTALDAIRAAARATHMSA